MSQAFAMAAHAADRFAPFTFERRALEPHDVRVDILYCGICHSDVHFARGEWGDPRYPCVPGHEIVGRVSQVGGGVTRFKAGDLAGIGCMVDSCRNCPPCREGLEQYCEGGGMVGTYAGTDRRTGGPTYGGYSDHIVVHEDYVLRVSHGEEQLAAVAPLLCAGITLYSPLRHWQAGPGKKVGIVGIGGLGHMGLKIARAMGAHVVAFTTSRSKVEEATTLGAHEVVLSSDKAALAAHAGTFDLIVNTVSASQDLETYVRLLRRDATLVLVGAGIEAYTGPNPLTLISRRRRIAGSSIGGIAETQEMLDFCAKHGIVADIEMADAADIEKAYDRIVASDVKYRFVLDIAALPQSSTG